MTRSPRHAAQEDLPMDQLQTRLDALEQQVQTLTQHTHTVTRQLCWWRGLACGVVVLAVLTWALPAVIAQDDTAERGPRGLAQRVAALEELLKHFSREKNEIFITGANLHIVNGTGLTGCLGEGGGEIPNCPNPNGLGNLIVGYNVSRAEFGEDIRTGSHNVVVGQRHNFSRFGGLVVGDWNTISAAFAVVSAGQLNTASGNWSSVSGGQQNTASGGFASVSGGLENTASAASASSVSGGASNTASGNFSSVSGGAANTASGEVAAVSGGLENTASGLWTSVSGGTVNTASGELAAVSGGIRNTASGGEGGGLAAVVSGGEDNTASGRVAMVSGGILNVASGGAAAVSGGRNITQEAEFGWSAGSEADEVVVGNFRSP
jgi:hypothetical protein